MSTISDNLIYRRVAPILLVFTLVIAIAAAVGTYVNDQNDRDRDRERISDNIRNSIVQCQNANESREASRTLWTYVINLSTAKGPKTPEQAAFVEDFRAYVNAVYRPHDCTDLDRKYPLPAPPMIPAK